MRGVVHNFKSDGSDSLTPCYAGGRPLKFEVAAGAETARVPLSLPRTLGRPYTRWSPPKLCDYLVEAGIVDDISVESVRRILDSKRVSFQR